jgi:copper chaperone CopZ
MKKIVMSFSVMLFALASQAQFSNASLLASGLTCSMCSKAVKEALQGVPFIQEVKVNIKTQEYNLVFKENSTPDFDALKKAVEDAGFSVARLKVTGNLSNVYVQKDKHAVVEGTNLHFLNGNNQLLNGTATFTIVEKDFLSAKDLKKYNGVSKMECMKTGKAGDCCTKDGVKADERVYHVII